MKRNEMKVWLVCRPLSNRVYPGQPSRIAFANIETAQAYVDEKNKNVVIDHIDYVWFIHEVIVLDYTPAKNKTRFEKFKSWLFNN